MTVWAGILPSLGGNGRPAPQLLGLTGETHQAWICRNGWVWGGWAGGRTPHGVPLAHSGRWTSPAETVHQRACTWPLWGPLVWQLDSRGLFSGPLRTSAKEDQEQRRALVLPPEGHLAVLSSGPLTEVGTMVQVPKQDPRLPIPKRGVSKNLEPAVQTAPPAAASLRSCLELWPGLLLVPLLCAFCLLLITFFSFSFFFLFDIWGLRTLEGHSLDGH